MFESAWASSPVMLMEAQASIRVDTSLRAFASLLANLRLAGVGPITSPFERTLFLIRAHDPEKCEAVFPRDKRGTRLRGNHASFKQGTKKAAGQSGGF
jgi:hypothetical protein